MQTIYGVVEETVKNEKNIHLFNKKMFEVVANVNTHVQLMFAFPLLWKQISKKTR